jgi:molecular chaperone DnaK
VADLKKAIESNDAAAMTRGMDALTQAQHKAAESLYRSQQQTGGPTPGGEAGGGAPGGGSSAGPGGGTQQGDVIDAEVVDEEKK